MLMRLSYPLPSIVGTVVQAPTELELELGLGFASILFLHFLWVSGLVGGWVLKLKLMLTQPPTELELKLGLSLAIGVLYRFQRPER